jgi:TonB family protein
MEGTTRRPGSTVPAAVRASVEERPLQFASGVPLVRLKLIVDEDGRVENAMVVDSCGDDRRDQAAVGAVNGKRVLPPEKGEDTEERVRVAYAMVAVASPESARLVSAAGSAP